ncbi:MAG TPA: MgtC/SapB family protein [Gemmatimonadaceae bacterium]|nr:MgtC/SapB family protein [Gemmatimonadaceae bacterium]
MIDSVQDPLRLELLIKLLVAVVLGGAVGVEREMSGKPAGLRTTILICVGAALFTHLSVAIGLVSQTPAGQPYGDVTRIAAQIVTGIGFLGAGAILHERGSVVGLTTAATIWVVAAIGMGVGAGAYAEAVGTTIMVCLVLIGLRPIERKLVMVRRTVTATLRVAPNTDFATFEDAFRDSGVHVRSRRTYDHVGDRTFELTLVGPSKRFDVLVDVLRRRQDVVSIYVD